MTNTQTERKYFWSTYNEALMENGEPFSLKLFYDSNGKFRHYAHVNAGRFPAKRYICIEFTPQCGRVRYGVCLENDIVLFDFLFENKEKIEKLLGFRCQWEQGTKGKTTRRIYCEKEIVSYDHNSYMDAIDESMPRLVKFAEVFDKLLIGEMI